jgi:hypothetical protein
MTQTAAAPVQRPIVNPMPISSDQTQVVTIATSMIRANATASASPDRLPRSHSQGRPGQASVRERSRAIERTLAWPA